MGMILRIASSRIVGQGDIVGRSGYFSLNLSANSVMRGRLDARRTLKSLVADLRYFTYLLQTMGIPERWEKEARAAIKQLEELTGDTFEDTSVRYQFTPLTPEEMQFVERRLSEGYYLPENIRRRKREAVLAAKRQKVADLKAAALRRKQKIDRELQVELYLFKLGAPLESFIYYDHSNEVAFNWTHRIYERERMSEEQYNALMKKIDPKKLPAGITFKFKPAA